MPESPMPPSLLEAALEYAAKLNWFVFPCEPGGKRPCGRLVPNGHLDATRDPDKIRAWWASEPAANVAVALAPSSLVALDIDAANGKKGHESAAEIDHLLTPTWTARTPRDGLHGLYGRPADVEPKRRIGFRPGLDLLGDGYIVLAPSKLLSGGSYVWVNTTAIAPVPRALLELAEARPEPKKVEKLREPIPAGYRNDSLYRLACALRDTGIGLEALANAVHWENQQRCKPPVDDFELKLIIDSAMRTVTPARDVAMGAMVAQQILEAISPKPGWLAPAARLAESSTPIRFIPTDFPGLDKLLGGGAATQSILGIIGPPSAGKSSFVGSLIREFQKHAPVLHVSTELPGREVSVRYAALEMGFAWRDGIRGAVDKQHMIDAVKDLRVEVIGCDDLDLNNPIGFIRKGAEDMRGRNGNLSPIIVVDYVQLLARSSDDKRRALVGELTKQLRIMAQQLDTIVVAVFSSRRDFYGGGKMEVIRQSDDPTLFLAAAKESGDIEFDCATLLYLDVDKMHAGQPKPARIAVARCRYGDVGFVGARAALDVGKWWDDPSAAAEMSQESRKERKEQATLDSTMLRVLDSVRKMPDRPWKELRAASGGSDKADTARDKLLELGTLRTFKKEFYHPETKRKHARAVYCIVEGSGDIIPPNEALDEPSEP